MTRSMYLATALATCFLTLGPAATAGADEALTEEEVSLESVPSQVRATLETDVNGKTIEEVEKIAYEGIDVLYEAEYHEDGEEYEVYVYPNGTLAAGHEHDEKAEEQY